MSNIFDTSPSGQFSPLGDSYYGCVDMSGNVWEWTATHSENEPIMHVVKGGAFNSKPTFTRTFTQNMIDPKSKSEQIGFRLISRKL